MDSELGFIIIVLGGWIGGGVIGGLVLGWPKGRALEGVVLGIILGPIAWRFIWLLDPTDAPERRRDLPDDINPYKHHRAQR
jgi:hypothetical protein